MRRILSTLVLLPALVMPIAAHADTLIFDLSNTNNGTYRDANSGPAQGVIASTTTTISGFSFYLETSAENVKFFITDGTGANVLYSGVQAVGSTSSFSWVESSPLSFTLDAGSEYYFGIVGDGANTNIGFIYPPVSYSANGLTADASGNANTSSFTTPTLELHSGGAEIGLQLYGGDSVAPTPEPSSFMLLGSGVLSAAGLVRRRFASNS